MLVSLSIGGDVAERFPETTIGAFGASGIGAASSRHLYEFADALDPVEALRRVAPSTDVLAQEPHIRAWRSAIGACGLKPSRFQCSVEQLARRALKGAPAMSSLPLVAAYCAVSLRHLTPMGTYDVETLPCQAVTLRLCRPLTDGFAPLGQRRSSMPLSEDVAVYASESEVLCYAFNHRDSHRTAVSNSTNRVLVIAESASRSIVDDVERALRDLQSGLRLAGAVVGPIVSVDTESPNCAVQIPS